MEKTIEELKQEADDLGIQYNANIGATKLAAKIEEHYAAQEGSAPAVKLETVAERGSRKKTIGERAAEARLEAMKTHIVTITDNDQRENNLTTIVSVNCSNDYFDLGTRRIPLNIPAEVEQGYINVLKEIQIPMHVRDNITGLGRTVLRNRYSIAYSNELKAAE